MIKPQWIDKTDYQRHIPRVFSLRLDERLKIEVHQIIGLDGWWFSCATLGISSRLLHDTELEKAQVVAVRYVAMLCSQLHEAMQKYLEEQNEAS